MFLEYLTNVDMYLHPDKFVCDSLHMSSLFLSKVVVHLACRKGCMLG